MSQDTNESQEKVEQPEEQAVESAESTEEDVKVDQFLLERVIDAVRPSLQADGGDIRFVSEKDGVVTVELTGSCAGCPLSSLTMSMGVERVLVENVPGVKRVEALSSTDSEGDSSDGLGFNADNFAF